RQGLGKSSPRKKSRRKWLVHRGLGSPPQTWARCPFRKFLASFLKPSVVWPWGIKVSLKPLRLWPEPGTPLLLLATCLTERNPVSHRRLRVVPRIRMGMRPVVVLKVSRVRQEGAPLLARAQSRRHERGTAEFRHHAADVQIPENRRTTCETDI